MKVYCIKKYYERSDRPARIIQKGYTLEQAREYCSDPETSSMTARPPLGCGGDPKKIAKWHERQKHWFCGFESEEI